MLRETTKQNDLITISEVTAMRNVQLVAEYVDILQVGSRNMYNYNLLEELGKITNPVLLKRSFCATIEEFLLSAEYIAKFGNTNIILCERGIRTFVRTARSILDVSAIPILKKYCHLPVVADPSHSVGTRGAVLPIAGAAIAAGADGLMIEVYTNPAETLYDEQQFMYPKQLAKLISKCARIASAVNRRVVCQT